jgi:hypothetical protein
MQNGGRVKLVACLAALIGMVSVGDRVVAQSAYSIDRPTSRIIDGTLVPVSQYPYVAQIVAGDFTCTGTLVASQYVLTAAHCFYDENNRLQTNLSNYGAVLNGTYYQAESVTVHPTYVSRSSACVEGETDAAIMKLSAAVSSITPIPLQRSVPQVGTQLLLVGFGTQGSGSSGENGTFPDDGFVNFGYTVIESVPNDSHVDWTFNSGESNTAGGDSGGPAFYDEAGTRYINSITCGGTGRAQIGTSSTNTRADTMAAWVDSVTGTSAVDQPPAFLGLASQTVGVGQAFSYTVVTTGAAPIAITSSELPPGLSLSGAVISGTPTTVGSYSVTLGATNSIGSASGTLTITVTAFDPGIALSVSKVTVSFEDDGDDLLAISGKITLGKKFSPKNKLVTVQVAELVDTFKLNKRGVARRRGGFDVVQLMGRLSRGSFTRSQVRYYIGLGDQEDLYDKLDQLFPADVEELEDDYLVYLPLQITVNGVSYQETVPMQYDYDAEKWVKAE